MGFIRRGWLWIAVVLLCGSAASAGGAGDVVEISVIVNNSVRVSPAVLRQAETEAGRIFSAAGFRVEWHGCDATLELEDPCLRVPGTNEFVVHIVPTGQTSVDSIFGIAFVGEDGVGKYCDVFFDRILEMARISPDGLSQLLGTVIAHELGHLLLGSHSHSPFGIMRAHWNNEELQRIAMGEFLFSSGEVRRMRIRVRETQNLAMEVQK